MRKANNIISLRASITFGCTLSGLTCMCVMRLSSDELWYEWINVTRVQHLNLRTNSSSQHYTGQLKKYNYLFFLQGVSRHWASGELLLGACYLTYGVPKGFYGTPRSGANYL